MKQREIKFRAWDGEKMRTDFYLMPDGRAWFLILDGTIHYTDWKVTQYTGLKDRNGREIYEGDIVKWGHIEGGLERPVRIAEVRIGAQVEFVSRQNGVVRKGEEEYRFGYGTFAYRDTERWLEVIGNVFENPELLEA